MPDGQRGERLDERWLERLESSSDPERRSDATDFYDRRLSRE